MWILHTILLTMCSAEDVDWDGMDRWKHSLCPYWHVPIAVGHDIEEVCPHDEWLQLRNCESGNVTNNGIDSWNLFCHMQQPFRSCCHQVGRVLMHHIFFSMKISCNSIMVWTDSINANSKSPPITYMSTLRWHSCRLLWRDSWSSLADTSHMVYLHASPPYQHTMYSTGQVKYRWHRQMKSLSHTAVLCSSPHHCYSYWPGPWVVCRSCCSCSWLVSWTSYPDWKEREWCHVKPKHLGNDNIWSSVT